MDGKTLARIGAVVFVVVAIIATEIQLTRKDEVPPAPAAPSPPTAERQDPLNAELARCSQAGEVATHDPVCLNAWAENRRRFLGHSREGL